jgi:hypothetical protein
MRAPFFVVLCAFFGVAATDARAQRTPPDPSKRADAVAHFERGVAHFDREEWSAALAEFMESRALFETASNTRNVAVCLRKLGRFDEALDMQEQLLEDFPSLPDREKDVARSEIRELRASVGYIELRGAVTGARVVVDGRERGVAPVDAPLRVGAGTHVVEVSRDGYLPFQTRVDVAGAETVAVRVALVAVTAAGRLRVSERSGGALEVVLDGAAVGTTPWEGAVAPGDHVVFLRGPEHVGTQPQAAPVKLGETLALVLLAETLGAELRVRAEPPSTELRLDGVPLGRGAWQGRVRAGVHTVDASAEGFLRWRRDVVVDQGAVGVAYAELTRNPSLTAPAGAFVLEADVGPALGVAIGGDLASSCHGACSADLPVGLRAVLHATYELRSGFGFGLDAGYLGTSQALRGRAASLKPTGLSPDAGLADDDLSLSAFTAGASVQLRRGGRWPLLLRIGAGVVVGSERDARTGTFTDSTGATFKTAYEDSSQVLSLSVVPEVRIGWRIGRAVEIDAGAEVLLLVALKRPTWSDGGLVLAGKDGVGTFSSQPLGAPLLVGVSPGIGARYLF